MVFGECNLGARRAHYNRVVFFFFFFFLPKLNKQVKILVLGRHPAFGAQEITGHQHLVLLKQIWL